MINPSKDYAKLVLMVHVFAIVMLFQSSLPALFIIIAQCLLLVCLIHLWRIKMPMPAYCKISYQAGHWLLEGKQGLHQTFDNLVVRFDGGFFIILVFTSPKFKKNLIVFNDQITKDQNRVIRLSHFGIRNFSIHIKK